MTPRRPSPARPGSRPGARPRARTPSRPASPQEVREGGHRQPPSRTQRAGGGDGGPAGDQAREQAPEHTMLHLGGSDRFSVPARPVILVLVLLGAFIVTFPSLRGYLSQRAQYDAIVQRVAEAEATSTALESELAKWQDEDYVRSQARERLSYVMPGETSYIVVGADAFDEDSPGGAPQAQASQEPRPWYDLVRESARAAGGTGAEGTPAPEPAQQGWSTAVPTVPTVPPSPGADPTAPPTQP